MQSADQSGTDRIYDEESGLGVEWVRDEPPMERARHFNLVLPDGNHAFIASYEYAIGLLMQQRPDLTAMEATRLAESDPTIEYQASNIDAEFDRQKFVEVWHKLLANRHSGRVVRVVYSEFHQSTSAQRREWSKSS